jgi:hypothetical protein
VSCRRRTAWHVDFKKQLWCTVLIKWLQIRRFADFNDPTPSGTHGAGFVSFSCWEKMMTIRCIATWALLALMLAGCQSTRPPELVDQSNLMDEIETTRQVPTGSAVFSSPAMALLLAGQGLSPGFAVDDWEYGRRDLRLPAGYTFSPPTTGSFVIIDRETQHDADGRIRTHGRRTIHSIEGGQIR